MARHRRFALTYAPEAIGHLDVIERKYHSLIRRVIDEQLGHTPDIATRNRKPLEEMSTLGGAWELRCGPQNRFRVFYGVDAEERRVRVLAIGAKEGGRLRVGREEIEL
jgi:mRNA-degrading endonuclease RelE of RelBE toxin-antitoxin system